MAARFVVRLTAAAERDLDTLPRQVQPKILSALKQLETNPYGPLPKIKKLKGQGVGQWRLEVWPYRVRYDVAGHDVIIYRVRHRKDIYR